jgi:hypothetical protein
MDDRVALACANGVCYYSSESAVVTTTARLSRTAVIIDVESLDGIKTMGETCRRMHSRKHGPPNDSNMSYIDHSAVRRHDALGVAFRFCMTLFNCTPIGHAAVGESTASILVDNTLS